MMITEQRLADGDGFHSLALLADKASSLLQAVASPSIVQLVMRLALAVPFWRSGVLKWAGFGKLSDTAVTLFTDEFTFLEGPTIFPAPSVMAFLSGTGEILFPVLLVLGLGTRVAALGLLFMTLIVELTVPDGWPIHSPGWRWRSGLSPRVRDASPWIIWCAASFGCRRAFDWKWKKALGPRCRSSGRTI